MQSTVNMLPCLQVLQRGLPHPSSIEGLRQPKAPVAFPALAFSDIPPQTYCYLLPFFFAQVLQRGLPRPSSIQGLPQPKAPAELEAMSLRERAEAELAAELAALVEHDNAAYPAAKEAEGKGKKDKKKRAK
jgi:hypothetical protein